MLEAEKLSNDAGMAHRVHEWQMKLEPKLQEEVHLFPGPHHPFSPVPIIHFAVLVSLTSECL